MLLIEGYIRDAFKKKIAEKETLQCIGPFSFTPLPTPLRGWDKRNRDKLNFSIGELMKNL